MKTGEGVREEENGKHIIGLERLLVVLILSAIVKFYVGIATEKHFKGYHWGNRVHDY